MSQHPATRCHTPPSIMCLRLRFLSRDTRPGRDAAQEAERTGATPIAGACWSWVVAPAVPPPIPRLGIAPVRFIPAGRLGFGPKQEAGSAWAGAGNWSQDRKETGAGNKPRWGWRVERVLTGKTVGG